MTRCRQQRHEPVSVDGAARIVQLHSYDLHPAIHPKRRAPRTVRTRSRMLVGARTPPPAGVLRPRAPTVAPTQRPESEPERGFFIVLR